MYTERFLQLRKDTLNPIFSVKNIARVWRKIVRQQLRHIDIRDIFDNYDFNYNVEERAAMIRRDVLNGSYSVSPPLIYKIEKKLGVCRHMIAPQPQDALILQVLVESIATKLLEQQPSKNAMFSRDKSNMAKPHEGREYGESLKKLWMRLQKKIYKFNKKKNLIVVTDLSNYYDSINMAELKKVVQGHISTHEVVIDLMFSVIEGISWRPDYLPYAHRGLPTSNIEAIRLLAHSLLFEVDEVLKRRTDNSFARWMDDIVFGADDRSSAINTISAFSDMLKSRGLALNLSKTSILTPEEGHFHFQIEKNSDIDKFETRIMKKDTDGLEEEVFESFEEHLKDESPKYWDKIAKRFITTLGKLRSNSLLPRLPEFYDRFPSLRVNLLIYLSCLGYSAKASKAVLSIVEQLNVFDDISAFQVCDLVASWKVPTKETAQPFLSSFDKEICRLSFAERRPSGFFSVLWFRAKYHHPLSLNQFIMKYENLWQTDSFLRRQVTAVLARTYSAAPEQVQRLLESQIAAGNPSSISIANQIVSFQRLTMIDNKLRFYLFPDEPPHTYPLPKFLVLCSILNSRAIRESQEVRSHVKRVISDPYYLKWLDAQFGI
ncbi:MAG TPA: RNA-directed DNA polymerase [Pirellulaceae bacterium]|nr:RNA-directed DNA polymerase [Pirellulaceae bacterium]HMO94456.1 RNA-directed DNA polymerase [Pirellulaceae bacterium]